MKDHCFVLNCSHDLYVLISQKLSVSLFVPITFLVMRL